MEFLVVIPARLGSTRLPRKVLADVGGLPMVERVRRAALRSRAGRVVVATPDLEVAQVVRAHGGEAAVTGDAVSGTDRVAQAVAWLGWDGPVINVQGDMPRLDPAHVDAVALLLGEGARIATLSAPLPAHDPGPDVVRVDVDAEGWARSFSRTGGGRRHLGLYGFAPGVLKQLLHLPPSATELRDRLEQLRWVEAGWRIAVAPVDAAAEAVDTALQLARCNDWFDVEYSQT